MTALAFGVALILSLAVAPLVRSFATRAGWVAEPSGDRWHTRPTALSGGIAIFLGTATAIFVTWGVLGMTNGGEGPSVEQIAIFTAATLMFAVGLVDDRIKLRPSAKLIAQAGAAALVISAGVIYPFTPWVPVNVLATVFWFIGVTNALNLLDNMDGAAAGVAGIAALFLTVSFGIEGEWALAAVSAALAGSALGFLPYNFSPSTIFMGDSGSLFLGAMLAGLGALYPGTASGSLVAVLFVPAILVVIPILDTALVAFTRTLAGRSISIGGRDHTSHRLVAFGLSEPQAVVALYTFAVIGGVVGLALRLLEVGLGLWIGGLFLVALAVLAAYLTGLHSYKEDERPPAKRTVLVSELFYKRRAAEVVLDLALFTVAYYGAFLLRWDASLPADQALVFEQTLALAVAAKSLAFGLGGVYRGVWEHTTIVDLHRIWKSSLLGALFTVGLIVFFFREAPFSRSVFVLDTLLVVLLTSGARASFRSLDVLRGRLNGVGTRALIYGAGSGGSLLLRELRSNDRLKLHPVGFIDDARRKGGSLIHGVPVLGSVDRLESLLREHRIGAVILATEKLPEERVAAVQVICRERDCPVYSLSIRLEVLDSVRSERQAPVLLNIQ